MFTNFTCQNIDDKHTLVEGVCVVTGKPVQIKVRIAALDDYFNRGLKAQDAFHDLPAGEREFFISGVSNEGFNKLFPPD